jgi:RNA polymerase sigma-70 factor (ECF subfamily)
MSDDELVNRAREGNQEAFGELIARNQEVVFAMLIRKVRDKDLALDLAQESFVRAYKGLDRFKGEAKFSSWLVRIALNRATSHFSSKQYKDSSRKIKDSERFFESLETPDSGSQELEFKSKLLWQGVEKLDSIYSQVLFLRAVENKSYREISEILEIPIGTVKSRMNTGINALRKSLGGKVR